MRNMDQVVAVGLLTERDLQVLGQGFRRMYRLAEGDDFDELLRRIDVAEQDRLRVPDTRQ